MNVDSCTFAQADKNLVGDIIIVGETLFTLRKTAVPLFNMDTFFLVFLAFPLFMLTYVPICIASLFTKVEWKPICHTRVMTLEQIEEPGLRAS